MKPKYMWACWGNSGGLFWDKPKQVKYDDMSGMWWDSCGDWEVKKQGFDDRQGWVCFAHKDRAEVRKFMQGYAACHKVIKSTLGA